MNMNPLSWEDPDCVCQAEYRAIHELAMCVWLSNDGETNTQRKALVRSSLIEMRDMLNRMLDAPAADALESAGMSVIERWSSGDLDEAVRALAAALKPRSRKR